MNIKLTSILISSFVLPFTVVSASAEKNHDHDHDHAEDAHAHDDKKGPNGGQVVESKAGFSFEVTVDKTRKARIVFLDKELKALPLDAQSITGIAGERSAPVKLTFAKGVEADANVLISDKPLPPGEHIQMLLMVKPTPDAKATTERFELHLH